MLYDNYKGSIEGFEKFNVLVMNMPRHQFAKMDISFIKELASLLNNLVLDPSDKITYPDIYCAMHEFILFNKPTDLSEYIFELFDFSLIEKKSIKDNYDKDNGKIGRKFRHLTEIMKMWNMLNEDNTINYEVCEEFFSLDIKELSSIRSKIIGMDIIDNNFFTTLKPIKARIIDNTIFSYKPAISIIKYMKEVNRPVSSFELSNLLGVILPEFKTSDELYDNAITIGKMMPDNIDKQQDWFFKYMNWEHSSGNYFQYVPSQDPEFKFKTFLLFMKDLDLINIKDEKSYILTDHSLELLSEKDIPAEVIELEKYISYAEKSNVDKDLADLILYNIKPSLLGYVAKNDKFIIAMNHRSLKYPKYDGKGKKIRNRLIAELAKIKANYTCQISQKPTFKDIKGNNYVESHHIVEFNGEDGPDIVDNLLVISPFYHSLIHHACDQEIFELYDHIRKNNIITIKMFKDMYDEYKCFDTTHVMRMLEKHLITKIEYEELVNYISNKK